MCFTLCFVLQLNLCFVLLYKETLICFEMENAIHNILWFKILYAITFVKVFLIM